MSTTNVNGFFHAGVTVRVVFLRVPGSRMIERFRSVGTD